MKAEEQSERAAVEARWGQSMAAAQAGDEKAYGDLLAELLPVVRRWVRSRLFDPTAAEDVVQNALLNIHRARHTYRAERPFLLSYEDSGVIEYRASYGSFYLVVQA